MGWGPGLDKKGEGELSIGFLFSQLPDRGRSVAATSCSVASPAYQEGVRTESPQAVSLL